MRQRAISRRGPTQLILGATLLGLAAGAAASSDISQRGDFGQIAKAGFTLTVDGSFFVPGTDKTEFPNLVSNTGDERNSYSWSGTWSTSPRTSPGSSPGCPAAPSPPTSLAMPAIAP
jgi:hypothetical protein